jgi:hypothetical protein
MNPRQSKRAACRPYRGKQGATSPADLEPAFGKAAQGRTRKAAGKHWLAAGGSAGIDGRLDPVRRIMVARWIAKMLASLERAGVTEWMP